MCAGSIPATLVVFIVSPQSHSRRTYNPANRLNLNVQPKLVSTITIKGNSVKGLKWRTLTPISKGNRSRDFSPVPVLRIRPSRNSPKSTNLLKTPSLRETGALELNSQHTSRSVEGTQRTIIWKDNAKPGRTTYSKRNELLRLVQRYVTFGSPRPYQLLTRLPRPAYHRPGLTNSRSAIKNPFFRVSKSNIRRFTRSLGVTNRLAGNEIQRVYTNLTSQRWELFTAGGFTLNFYQLFQDWSQFCIAQAHTPWSALPSIRGNYDRVEVSSLTSVYSDFAASPNLVIQPSQSLSKLWSFRASFLSNPTRTHFDRWGLLRFHYTSPSLVRGRPTRFASNIDSPLTLNINPRLGSPQRPPLSNVFTEQMRQVGFHLQRAFFRGLMHRLNVHNKKSYRLLRAFSTYPISDDFRTNLQTRAVIPELPVALRGMFSKNRYPNYTVSASAVTPLYTFRRQVNRYFDLGVPRLATNTGLGTRTSDRLKSVPTHFKGSPSLHVDQIASQTGLRSRVSPRLRPLIDTQIRIQRTLRWTRPRNRKRRRLWRRDLRYVLKSTSNTLTTLKRFLPKRRKSTLKYHSPRYLNSVDRPTRTWKRVKPLLSHVPYTVLSLRRHRLDRLLIRKISWMSKRRHPLKRILRGSKRRKFKSLWARNIRSSNFAFRWRRLLRRKSPRRSIKTPFKNKVKWTQVFDADEFTLRTKISRKSVNILSRYTNLKTLWVSYIKAFDMRTGSAWSNSPTSVALGSTEPVSLNFTPAFSANSVNWVKLSACFQPSFWQNTEVMKFFFFTEFEKDGTLPNVDQVPFGPLRMLARRFQSLFSILTFSNQLLTPQKSNIWVSSQPSLTFRKTLIRLSSFKPIRAPLAFWYYRTLIHFMESVSGRQIALHLSGFITDCLTFEDRALCRLWSFRVKGFQRILGHKIFLHESLLLITTAVRLKDPKFLANWIRAMLYRMSFWKYRLLFRYLRFVLRHLIGVKKDYFQLRGIKLRLKGKISVAGNARTRTLVQRVGDTSHAKLSNRVAYDLSLVRSFTGVMGFKLWFFY